MKDPGRAVAGDLAGEGDGSRARPGPAGRGNEKPTKSSPPGTTRAGSVRLPTARDAREIERSVAFSQSRLAASDSSSSISAVPENVSRDGMRVRSIAYRIGRAVFGSCSFGGVAAAASPLRGIAAIAGSGTRSARRIRTLFIGAGSGLSQDCRARLFAGNGYRVFPRSRSLTISLSSRTTFLRSGKPEEEGRARGGGLGGEERRLGKLGLRPGGGRTGRRESLRRLLLLGGRRRRFQAVFESALRRSRPRGASWRRRR